MIHNRLKTDKTGKLCKKFHALISPAATYPLPSSPRYPTTRRIGQQGEVYDTDYFYSHYFLPGKVLRIWLSSVLIKQIFS